MSLNPCKLLKKNVGKNAVQMEVRLQSQPCQGASTEALGGEHEFQGLWYPVSITQG